MANNVISEMLEYDSKFHPQWAAKLDRLVEAAEKVTKEHPNTRCDSKNELAAALAAIKLPEAANGGE